MACHIGTPMTPKSVFIADVKSREMSRNVNNRICTKRIACVTYARCSVPWNAFGTLRAIFIYRYCPPHLRSLIRYVACFCTGTVILRPSKRKFVRQYQWFTLLTLASAVHSLPTCTPICIVAPWKVKELFGSFANSSTANIMLRSIIKYMHFSNRKKNSSDTLPIV